MRTTRLPVDTQQKGLNAVSDAQVFPRDHVFARQQGFDLARLDDRVATLHALDRAGDQMFLALQEVVENLVALGVADFLQDDLLGRLRTNAPEIDRFQLFLKEITDFNLRILLLGFRQGNLHFFAEIFLVRNDDPAAEGFKITGIAIDDNPHVGFVVDALLARRSQRQLERTKDNFPGNILFAGQHINQQQNFTAHILTIPCLSWTLPVEFRNQPRLVHVGQLQFHVACIHRQADFAILHAAQNAVKIATSGQRQPQSQIDFRTGEALEIGQLFQYPVKTGRGNFKTLVIDVLHRQNTGQLVADQCTVLDIDAAFFFRLVDEYAQDTASRTLFDVHELVTETRYRFVEKFVQIHGYK